MVDFILMKRNGESIISLIDLKTYINEDIQAKDRDTEEMEFNV